MQIGQNLKIKGGNPLLILQQVKDAFLASFGIYNSQVTLNDVAISTIKTIKKTIGGVGVTGCDYNFTTADNATEQVIKLDSIIPAHARIIDIKTHTEVGYVPVAIDIASWSVDTNVATITTVQNHSLVSTNSVAIAGIVEDDLTGTHTVTVTGAKTFTIPYEHANTGTTADEGGTVTPTITLVAETGNASSGNQFISSATIKAKDAITAVAAILGVAPAAAASHVYVAATPNAKWPHITTGKTSVYITYAEKC